jgi:hypothetical protein
MAAGMQGQGQVPDGSAGFSNHLVVRLATFTRTGFRRSLGRNEGKKRLKKAMEEWVPGMHDVVFVTPG